MRTAELGLRFPPHRLPAREVPHVTVEPNKTCNIHCAACYSRDHSTVRTLAEVVADVDRARQLRNLESVTLIGGEPTLHPELPAMVRAIKERGLICMLLTNGLALAQDERLIDALIAAGLDRFLLHIDAGQAHVHGDVAAFRRAMCDRLEARGAWFAIAVTVRSGDEAGLPALARELARYRHFDGVLATLAFDFDSLFGGAPAFAKADGMAVHRAMLGDLRVAPTAWVPTSADDDEVAWLMYLWYHNAATGRTFACSSQTSRAFRALYRLFAGRHFFAATTRPGLVPLWFALQAICEVALRPWRIADALRMLRHPGQVRFLYVVVQDAPHFGADGQLRICWHCHDAVMRKGRLLPVCMADQLDPMHGEPRAPAAVVRGVREHLEAS